MSGVQLKQATVKRWETALLGYCNDRLPSILNANSQFSICAQIALNECKKAASSMRDLEEIWFAFFEKPVYTAFINAAEELLEPVTSVSLSGSTLPSFFVDAVPRHNVC